MIYKQFCQTVVLYIIVQFLVAQPLLKDIQRLPVAGKIGFDVGILAPEVGLQDSAATDADFHAPVAEVIQHTDFFNQTQRMVQGQNVDPRPQVDPLSALGCCRQEYVLRRGQVWTAGV